MILYLLQVMTHLADSFETWKTTGKVSNKIAWFKRKDGTIFPGLISAKNFV